MLPLPLPLSCAGGAQAQHHSTDEIDVSGVVGSFTPKKKGKALLVGLIAQGVIAATRL